MRKQRTEEKPGNDGVRPWLNIRWRTAIYALLLTFVFIRMYDRIRDDRVYLGGDNADYYILAESIAAGQGYHYVALPDAPAHNHFPPGYPFMLATFMRMGITGIDTLTGLNGLFLWAALMVFLGLFTRFSGDPELAAISVGLCAINAHLLEFSTIMMSEVPYLFVFTVALGAYIMMLRAEEQGRRTIGWSILLVVAAILMVYIRTAGAASVLAIAGHMAWRRRWRVSAILLGAVLLSQVPWQLRSMKLGRNSYVEQLLSVNPYRPEQGKMTIAAWPGRILRNMERYALREVPSSVLPWTTRKLDSPMEPREEWIWPVLVLPLVVVGLVQLQKQRALLVILLTCSFGVLLLWPPVWAGVRFMLALVPFTVFLWCQGLFALLRGAAQRLRLPAWSPWVPMVPALLIVASNDLDHALLKGRDYTNARVMEMAKHYAVKADPRNRILYSPCCAGLEADRRNPYANGYNEYLRMAAWAGKNLPAQGAIVCCRKPGLFYLFAHRTVTTYAKTLRIDSLIADLKAKKVTHVVVDQMGFADMGRYLVPAVQRDELKFPILHTEPAPDDPKKLTYLLGFRPELGYDGPWVNGRKKGKAVMRYPDKSWLESVWVNDTLNGPGVLHRPDSSRVEGDWYISALNGYGRIIRDGKVTEEGLWKNGRKVTDQ